jgi:1,4-alpha-glucan branching enzyme
LQECVKDLNFLYKDNKALHELQFNTNGFEWVDLNHRDECVAVYMRKGKKKKERMLIILNMTPVVRKDWKITVKGYSAWKEVFNTNEKKYFGTGDVYNVDIKGKPVNKSKRIYEINVQLPALSAVVLSCLE